MSDSGDGGDSVGGGVDGGDVGGATTTTTTTSDDTFESVQQNAYNESDAGAAATRLSSSTYDTNSNCQPCNPLKILQFVERLSTTTDSIEMQILINNYLQNVTQSTCVFMVPYLPSSEEGLIQVIGDRKLDKDIRFSMTSEICTELIDECVQVTAIEPSKDLNDILEMVIGPKHNTQVFDIKNSKTTSSCMTRQTSLFVCIAGDVSLCSTYNYHIKEIFRYILGHLLTAFELFEEKLVRMQCQNLLQIARRLLSKIGDLGQLLRGVMAEARDMTGAERCSLFLIDPDTNELVSKVFDGDEATTCEVRIEEGKGIAGLVSKSGKLLNIRNAYQHPLFYKRVDEQTGFKTRNILCFPICDEESVIGVAQLCNKVNGFYFDKCDEQIATAFSIYCGISIMHSMVHQRVQKAEARHKLSQDILSYHWKVPNEDVNKLQNNVAMETIKMENFSSFSYNPRETEYSHSVELAMKMFIDLDFIRKFRINEDKLARFLLTVRKGYREIIPYHNWTHAFSVSHFAYCLMTNLKLFERGILTDLQGLAFLVACLCHDLDHRGTNNSFQLEAKSPLARLYSSEGSVNERHHLSQAICLLNQESCRILDGVTTDEFKECIDMIKHLILATDLANHFRIINQLKELNPDNLKDNTELLMSLLITCCDLSDQTLPWPMTKTIAELLYAEFFAQGDLERQMGIAPTQMMDRQNACVPELQIEFLSTVVMPTFEILADLFPETERILDVINDNRRQWELVNTSYSNCL